MGSAPGQFDLPVDIALDSHGNVYVADKNNDRIQKFDPDGAYRRRWIAEGSRAPTKTALSYFDAIPRSWGLSPDTPYPERVVELSSGRTRALAAYEARSF